MEPWVDPASGEVHESYAMLTQNADAHPLMRRMHRPVPALAPDRQDKRSVVPLAADDITAWLHGTPDEARALIRLPALETIAAGPAVG